MSSSNALRWVGAEAAATYLVLRWLGYQPLTWDFWRLVLPIAFVAGILHATLLHPSMRPYTSNAVIAAKRVLGQSPVARSMTIAIATLIAAMAVWLVWDRFDEPTSGASGTKGQADHVEP